MRLLNKAGKEFIKQTWTPGLMFLVICGMYWAVTSSQFTAEELAKTFTLAEVLASFREIGRASIVIFGALFIPKLAWAIGDWLENRRHETT